MASCMSACEGSVISVRMMKGSRCSVGNCKSAMLTCNIATHIMGTLCFDGHSSPEVLLHTKA